MNEFKCPCNRIIKASSYTSSASFNINTAFIDNNMKNGKRYKLILCATLPSMIAILPVNLIIGGKTYPILNYLGNNLMSDQLKTRRAYCIILGTNPNHFIINDCIKNSVFYEEK